MRFGLWLLVVVAGCRIGFDKRAPDGGESIDAFVPAFEPYWQSGTRYRARLLVPVEGGDPYWIGWHDTMLGMDCISGVAADGVERCVHQDQRASDHFADAGCTQPLGWVRPSTCGAPGYVFDRDAMGRVRVYRSGPTYAGTRYLGDGCTLTTGPTSGELVTLGAEVPANMMGEAQYTSVTVGSYDRLYQGLRDGARVEIGTLDTPLGSCFPLARTLGPAPCVASPYEAVPVYLDSNCSQLAYNWIRQVYEPDQTSQIVVYDRTACEESYRLFSVTADVTAPMHYRRAADGGCNAQATAVTDRLYVATEIADPMPMGTLVIGPRRGRLGYLYWIDPDGEAIATRYWDHDLGTPCLPINGTDGKLRCIPSKGHWFEASPDGTCTAPTQTLVSGCFGTSPVDGTSYTSCTDYWPVTALPQVTSIASTFETTCSSLTDPAGYYDPLQSGAEIPPTMFAEMMEIVE